MTSTIRAIVIAVVLLVFCSPAFAADEELGPATSIDVPGVGQVMLPAGSVAYRDSAGQIYIKRPNDKDLKPQKGDTVHWTDKGGKQQSESVTASSDSGMQHLHQYHDSIFATVSPTHGGIGALIYPLALPDALSAEFESSSSAIFGDSSIYTLGFLGFEGDASSMVLFGSSTADLHTPTEFFLDLGSQWFSMTDAAGSPAFQITAGDVFPTGEFDEEMVTNSVAEPPTLLLTIVAIGVGLFFASGVPLLNRRL